MKGIYAIANISTTSRLDEAWASAVLKAGCAAIQLRAKDLSDDAFIEDARRLKQLAATYHTPFVVNDRADIAELVKADALHLGQDDVPIAEARKVVGDIPIGVSTHSLAQAQEALASGADHIGFGPIFNTATKDNPDPTVGVSQLQQVCRTLQIDVVAIGGIQLSNVASVYSTGAACVAVISAIAGTPETVEGRIGQFQALFDQSRTV